MDMNVEMFDYHIAAAAFIGFIECFFGYRIFRFLLGVIGFVIGAVVAGSLGFELSGGSEFVSIVSGIAGGFAGALLMYLLYVPGVFVIGAVFGFMIVSFVYGFINEDPVTWIVIASCVAVGALSVLFRRPMIILATSFGGSFAAVTGISYLIMKNFNPFETGFLNSLGEDQLYRMAIIWFAIGVFGFVVQYMMIPGNADIDREPEPPGSEGDKQVQTPESGPSQHS